MKLCVGYLSIFCFLSFAAAVIKVPNIDECLYVDAYYAECSWTRPAGDNSSIYRLLYVRREELFLSQTERVCKPTAREVAEDGSVKERCSIWGTAYGKFNFTLSLQCANCTDQNCTCGIGKTFEFECDPEFVVIRAPPSKFHFHEYNERLTWDLPVKEHSMLQYVFSFESVEYKLEYANASAAAKGIWEVIYIGPHTGVYLPQLREGLLYVARVYARLQPKNNSKVPNWSWPAVVKFEGTYVSNLSEQAPTTTVVITTAAAVAAEVSTNRTSLWVASSLALATMVALIFISYKLFYRRLFSMKRITKASSPIVLLEMDDLLPANLNRYQLSSDDFTENVDVWQPLTRFLEKPRECGGEPGSGDFQHQQQHRRTEPNAISSLIRGDLTCEGRRTNTNTPHRAVAVDVHSTANEQGLRKVCLLPNGARNADDSLLELFSQPSSPRGFLPSATHFNRLDREKNEVSSSLHPEDTMTYNRSELSDRSTSDFDYVVSATPTEQFLEADYVSSKEGYLQLSKDDACDDDRLSIPPEYVRQAMAGEHDLQVFLAVNCGQPNLEDAMAVTGKGLHVHNSKGCCLKLGGVTLPHTSKATCPFCKFYKPVPPAEGDRAGTPPTPPTPPATVDANEHRRSSASANSVDSGYSPDSPVST